MMHMCTCLVYVSVGKWARQDVKVRGQLDGTASLLAPRSNAGLPVCHDKHLYRLSNLSGLIYLFNSNIFSHVFSFCALSFSFGLELG